MPSIVLALEGYLVLRKTLKITLGRNPASLGTLTTLTRLSASMDCCYKPKASFKKTADIIIFELILVDRSVPARHVIIKVVNRTVVFINIKKLNIPLAEKVEEK